MVQKWKHGFEKDQCYILNLWYRLNSWYRLRLMGHAWTHGIDMDTWFRPRLMVLPKTHDMYIDLWYLQHPWY